ncbi:MAG: DUF819 family protein [Fuerstiella sp.]|nr:DUF819 family protein [Fuerstiella sp.]
MILAATESLPLIVDSTALFVFFSGFVACIFLAARTPKTAVLFHYIPPIVWIYLLPVFGTTWGITPAESPLYDWCSLHLLPAALLLLTISTDVKAIARLGPLAIGMLLAGTAGIVVGGPITLAIFQSHLDPQTWKAMAALAGSWIGGGSNMLAIKEGVHCPDDIFSPIIIVDSVVGYGWMTIMIGFGRYQDNVDQWNRADRRVLNELNTRLTEYKAANARPITLPGFAMILGTGFVGGWLCMWGGNQIPEMGSVLSHYTWGILLVVVVGLVLSFTPVRRIEHEGASPVAYGGLYLLVATMGATGNLRAIAEAPLLLLTGVVWIGIHILFLTVAARVLRAPCFLFATGSMGNVGGVISTPVVAGVYQPALAPVGILMGVLGSLVGTPAGLLCAQLMSWVAAAHFDERVINGLP